MGGMETYSKELSEALTRFADVEVIALPGQADGAVPKPIALLGFGLRAAGKLLFRRKPAEVVHIGDMASWPLAVFVRLRRPSTRIVISAHGTDVSYPLRGGLRGKLYAFYLRVGAQLLRGAGVIANSAATASAAQSYGFSDPAVVPLAAEIPPIEAPKLRAETILFSGRLIPLKGCAWFIREVLPLLPEEMRLEVAGTIWDAEEGVALDHPRVTHLGRMEQIDLWRRFAEALCIVVPNIDVPTGQFEGFGLVALEGAAAGGVVLASSHGGLKEAVLDGVTGFHMSPGDAKAWAAKITEIAGWSDERRAEFTTKAAEVCAKEFNWERVAADTFSAYGFAP